MRYAIETQDGVFVRNGDTPFPEGSAFPAPLDYIPSCYYKIVAGSVVEKSADEKRIVDLPLKYRRYENGTWVELTAGEKEQVDADEAALAIDLENQRQASKPVKLRIAENTFLALCDTLTGTVLHEKLGFAELQAIILAIPDQSQMMLMAVQLLAIDAEAKREGGNLWWDDCKWHAEL